MDTKVDFSELVVDVLGVVLLFSDCLTLKTVRISSSYLKTLSEKEWKRRMVVFYERKSEQFATILNCSSKYHGRKGGGYYTQHFDDDQVAKQFLQNHSRKDVYAFIPRRKFVCFPTYKKQVSEVDGIVHMLMNGLRCDHAGIGSHWDIPLFQLLEKISKEYPETVRNNFSMLNRARSNVYHHKFREACDDLVKNTKENERKLFEESQKGDSSLEDLLGSDGKLKVSSSSIILEKVIDFLLEEGDVDRIEQFVRESGSFKWFCYLISETISERKKMAKLLTLALGKRKDRNLIRKISPKGCHVCLWVLFCQFAYFDSNTRGEYAEVLSELLTAFYDTNISKDSVGRIISSFRSDLSSRKSNLRQAQSGYPPQCICLKYFKMSLKSITNGEEND